MVQGIVQGMVWSWALAFGNGSGIATNVVLYMSQQFVKI